MRGLLCMGAAAEIMHTACVCLEKNRSFASWSHILSGPVITDRWHMGAHRAACSGGNFREAAGRTVRCVRSRSGDSLPAHSTVCYVSTGFRAGPDMM